MNELLGWYGYETSRDEHKPSKKCRNPSECNDSEGEAVKFTGKYIEYFHNKKNYVFLPLINILCLCIKLITHP